MTKTIQTLPNTSAHRIKIRLLLATFILASSMAFAPRASGQTNSTWLGDGTGNNSNGNWSNASLWNPATVPNNSGPALFDVTIPYYPGNQQFNGPQLDINVTIRNLTLVNRVFLDNQGYIGTTLNVTGSTTLSTTPGHEGETAAVFASGDFRLGTLTNYNATTKTLQDGFFFALNGGSIQFRGADIVTNNGTLVVGDGSQILNQDNGVVAYANLAVNNGGFNLGGGHNFTTVGNFTNNGGFSVGTSGNLSSVFTVGGLLTNFDPATHTLSGGFDFTVDSGTGTGTATLRFAGADIRTLTNTSVNIRGAGASIRDLQGNSAFRNLETIQNGSFTSGGIETYTPSGGTLINNNSQHTISPGAVITVQGNFHVMNGGSTIISAPTDNSNTVVVVQGSMLIDANSSVDMGGQPGVTTQYHTTLQVINGIEYRGAFLTGTGTTFADILFTQNAHIQPGHSPGQLTVQGNITMDNTTSTEMQLGGTSAGDQFDQIVQTGGTVTLGGKLLVSFVDGFENVVTNDDTFDIITSDAALGGSFSNIVSGQRLATSDGKGTFIVTYSGKTVTLSQFFPPPKILSVTKMPNEHFKIFCQGYPEAGVYRLEASDDLNPVNFSSIETIGTSDGSFLEFEDFDSDNHPRRFYRIIFPDDSPPAAARMHATTAHHRKNL
ncbi:MAG: hypothetical protein ACR2HH_01250 [Chthoniobacterales bacterium]